MEIATSILSATGCPDHFFFTGVTLKLSFYNQNVLIGQISRCNQKVFNRLHKDKISKEEINYA